jgi:hypothetical protein
MGAMMIVQSSCTQSIAPVNEAKIVPAPQANGQNERILLSKRIISLDEAKKIPGVTTEAQEQAIRAFRRQSLPMVQGDSISPLELAELMETSFSKTTPVFVRFLAEDEFQANEFKQSIKIRQMRLYGEDFFPDKDGMFNPFFLMKEILPDHSLFWTGTTLVLSRSFSGD